MAARYQRRRDDKGILHLPQLVGCQNAGAHGGGGLRPLPQGGGVAAADKVDDGLLEGEGVVHRLRAMDVRVEVLPGLFRLPLSFQPALFGVVDIDVAQSQLFAVHDIVDGAQDLQHAVRRQGHEALHPRDELVRLLGGHVAAEGELFQRLVAALDLYRRPDDDAQLLSLRLARHHAVVVEVRGDKIADVRAHGEDLFPVGAHGVFGQGGDGVVKYLRSAAEDAHGDARQVADDGAQIPVIDVFHLIFLQR